VGGEAIFFFSYLRACNVERSLFLFIRRLYVDFCCIPQKAYQ
jgi:hypothetical protein